MKQKPKVVALVVTYNRKELLRENLLAIQTQTYPVSEILVVDNHSDDGTYEMLKQDFPSIKVLRTEANIGGAGGFAKGIAWSLQYDYDWLWVMDDDTIPYPDSLDKLIEASQEREYAAVGSSVYWINGKRHPMNWPWRDLRRPFLKSKYGRIVLWLSFVSAMISRNAITRHGLPNKNFFLWNDDIEYFTRLSTKKPLLEVRDSRVLHKSKTNYTPALSNPDRYFYQVRNRLWLAKSSHLPVSIKTMLVFHFLGELPLFIYRNPAKAWRVILRGLRAGIMENPYAHME